MLLEHRLSLNKNINNIQLILMNNILFYFRILFLIDFRKCILINNNAAISKFTILKKKTIWPRHEKKGSNFKQCCCIMFYFKFWTVSSHRVEVRWKFWNTQNLPFRTSDQIFVSLRKKPTRNFDISFWIFSLFGTPCYTKCDAHYYFIMFICCDLLTKLSYFYWLFA